LEACGRTAETEEAVALQYGHSLTCGFNCIQARTSAAESPALQRRLIWRWMEVAARACVGDPDA